MPIKATLAVLTLFVGAVLFATDAARSPSAQAAPFASGFTYELLTPGVFFVSVTLGNPPGVPGPFSIEVGGSEVGQVSPGNSFTFGANVATFDITGIAPPVDVGDPNSFPVQLVFTESLPSFSVTPILAVPEPSAVALLAVGLAGVGLRRREGRAS